MRYALPFLLMFAASPAGALGLGAGSCILCPSAGLSTVETLDPIQGNGLVADPVTINALSNITISSLTVIETFQVAVDTFVVTGGHVGIGITNPEFMLQLEGNGGATGVLIKNFSPFPVPFLALSAIPGSKASSSPITTGNFLGLVGYGGMTPSGPTPLSPVTLIGIASENWTNSALGSRLTINTTENGTTTNLERMVVANDGNVGIGISNPTEQLDVAENANISGSLVVGSSVTISTGSSLTFMLEGSDTNDPPTISGNSSTVITLTATGANVGDICHVQAASLEADLGLESLGVTPNDILNVRVGNWSNMMIDPASQAFDFVCLRF